MHYYYYYYKLHQITCTCLLAETNVLGKGTLAYVLGGQKTALGSWYSPSAQGLSEVIRLGSEQSYLQASHGPSMEDFFKA